MSEYTHESISAVVKEFIQRERTDIIQATIDKRTALIDDGILDSLFLMQLLSFLENRFTISLNFDLVTPENFGSIESIARLVQNHLE